MPKGFVKLTPENCPVNHADPSNLTCNYNAITELTTRACNCGYWIAINNDGTTSTEYKTKIIGYREHTEPTSEGGKVIVHRAIFKE